MPANQYIFPGQQYADSTAGAHYNNYSGSGQNVLTLPGAAAGNYASGSTQDYTSGVNSGLAYDLENAQTVYPDFQTGVGETNVNRPITTGSVLAIAGVALFAYMLITARR